MAAEPPSSPPLENIKNCHSERNEVKRRTELCELTEGNLHTNFVIYPIEMIYYF